MIRSSRAKDFEEEDSHKHESDRMTQHDIVIGILLVIACLAFIFAILAYTGSGGADSDKLHFDVGNGLFMSDKNMLTLAPIGSGQVLGNAISSTMGDQVPKGVAALTQGSLMSGGSPETPFQEIFMRGKGLVLSSLNGKTPGWSEPMSGATYQIDPSSDFFQTAPSGIFKPMHPDRVYVSYKPSFVDMEADQLIRRVELLMRIIILSAGSIPESVVYINPAHLLPPNTQVTTKTVPIASSSSFSVNDADGAPVLGLNIASSFDYKDGETPQFELTIIGNETELAVNGTVTLNMVVDIPFQSLLLGS
jgi:hypothetical protein